MKYSDKQATRFINNCQKKYDKLQKKLVKLEKHQNQMKKLNAFFVKIGLMEN